MKKVNFLNKVDYFKHELKQAFNLYKDGLISYVERKIIEYNIFQSLIKYFQSIGDLTNLKMMKAQCESTKNYILNSELSFVIA